MLKKFFPVWLTVLLIMAGTSVLAAEVSIDHETGMITIIGEAEENAEIGIQVLQKDVCWDKFEQSGFSSELIAYNDQTSADEAGKFQFRFGLNGSSGNYHAYLSYSLQTGEELLIDFIRFEDVKKVLDELNFAASQGDEQQFFAILSENKKLFGGETNEIEENISFKKVSDKMCQYVKEHPLKTEEKFSARMVYYGFVIIEAIEEEKLDNPLPYMQNLLHAECAKKWFDVVKERKGAIEHIQKVLLQNSPKTPEKLVQVAEEAVLLTVVRYPGGWENLRNTLEDFGGIIHIGKVESHVCKAVAGKSYTSVDTLKKEILRLSGKESAEGGGFGGGSNGEGGHGGIGSGSSGGLTGGKYEPDLDEIQKPDKIELPFIDIDGVAWARESIIALYDKKIISGKTTERFYPNDLITREEFVKILVLANKLIPVSGKGRFSDVPSNSWYNGYINAGVQAGLVKGIAETRFGTGMYISRQDIAVLLCRAANLWGEKEKAQFQDMNEVADYAVDAVGILASQGIVMGSEDGKFLPTENATRAEAVKMLYGILKYLN